MVERPSFSDDLCASGVPAGEELEPDEVTARIVNEGAADVREDENEKLLATKEGEMFLLANQEGNILSGAAGMGLYHRDTRYLSYYEMRLGDLPPLLLSSSAERSYMSYVDLTNPDLWEGNRLLIQQQTVNIRRSRVISGDRLFERIRFKNYNATPVALEVTVSFGVDFADIFEVRGLRRQRRGRFFKPKVEDGILIFAYVGEDAVLRRTRIEMGVAPSRLSLEPGAAHASFLLELSAHQTRMLSFVVEPVASGAEPPPAKPFDVVVHELRRSYEEWERSCTSIYTDNELFNSMLHRGLRDVRALLTDTSRGRYIAAGIPWYVSLFGRDSILTAHQILMLNPAPARDTLRTLARLQGREDDPWRDEEPGKILHEVRCGELANAQFVPHSPYYGSVDSTPLFLILLATYYRWTNDLGFVHEMMPAVDAALRWIDEYGDLDGDGFVEYRRRSPRGMDNQGWKDSFNAVAHADGSLADPPIAIAEVQGYVYLAKRRAAELYERLGDAERASALRLQAQELKRRFNEAFWLPDERFFALALDGEKRPVRTVATNPAHGLYCDIIDRDKADEVARRLFQPDMFSGWGVRTMSKAARAYNPMSYHNGSVWPHDNALVAAGLKRYGFHKQTNRIATALFDAAVLSDYIRLPELFCGFTRRTPNRPVGYPVACSPQAWAAGAPFLMLQAMLGLSARAPENLLTVNSPVLPPWLNTVQLKNLRVGDSTLSLTFRREGEMTAFSLVSKEGSVRVVMEE